MTTTLAPPSAVPPFASPASATPTVTAVLVVSDGATWLPTNLDALAAQSRPPERLVVVDLASGDGSREIARAHEGVRGVVGHLSFVDAPARMPFGRAVRLALDSLDSGLEAGADKPGSEWLWLLHDDSAAAPTTLARLVEAVRRSRTVGIAGPKLQQWSDPRRLVEMGIQVTRTGRRVDAPTFGEPDQGQYDTRTDVLAVGTSGMLVRRDVFDGLGGFDPAFPRDSDDLDLGWRAQLAGHRVVVVPGATMREAATGRGETAERDAAGGEPRDRVATRLAQRRAARQVALTRCSLLLAPFLGLWMAVTSVLGAIGLLLLKRPQHAWAELGDLGALTHPLRSTKARWRFRHGRRVRRRHLATLFVSVGAATASSWDRVQEALTPTRHRPTAVPGSAAEPTETGPVAEEAESLATLPASLPQRIVTNPGFLVVLLCAALSAVTFRTALAGGVLDAQGPGLAGGELNAVATGSGGLWHLFRDSWHGAGFGNALDVSPAVGLLGGLTWLVEWLPYVDSGRSPASVAMAWLLLAAMPLSALTAYLAARVATRARWGRALVALAWGCSGVLFAALGDGRLSVVVAHILLPLVVAGFAAALKPGGSWTVTFAAALVTGVVGAFVPALLAVSVAVAVVAVAVGPGLARRLRALVLAVVPTMLLGPWVVRFVDDPRLLLTGAGLLDVTPDTPPAWQVALGQPDGSTALLAWLFAPVLLVAILALARRSGGRGRSAALTGLAALAVVGLALALGSERVEVGQAVVDGQPALATLWSGVGLDVYVAAVLAILLAGWHGLTHVLGERRLGWRRLLAAAGVTIVAAALAAAGGISAWRGAGALTVGNDGLPAVAVDQASGSEANRMLVLTPSSTRIDFSVVGNEPGDLMRDVERAHGVTDPGVGNVVSELASGAGTIARGAGSALADLGVGFVSLHAPSDSPLARTLDASSGLTRLGSSGDQTLWRVLARPSAVASDVAVPPARVRIADAAGAPVQAVPVAGPHGAVDEHLSVGAQGRRVVFAQPPEWTGYAVVTFDGQRLVPTSSAGTPTYALPAAVGQLVVDLPPSHPRWFLAQLGLLAVVVFLAVPFGNKRSRRLR